MKIKYSDFLNEINLPILKIDEIISNVDEIKNNSQKKTLSVIFKTYEQYIDVVNKKSHHFKIHDMSGDIMVNNRVTFDAFIFNDPDLEQIIKNIIYFGVSEFFVNLPDTINVFGIDMKVSSFINKDELKTVLEQNITKDETIRIITEVLGFKYDGYLHNCYVWSNKQ